jgi:hypothetical protein
LQHLFPAVPCFSVHFRCFFCALLSHSPSPAAAAAGAGWWLLGCFRQNNPSSSHPAVNGGGSCHPILHTAATSAAAFTFFVLSELPESEGTGGSGGEEAEVTLAWCWEKLGKMLTVVFWLLLGPCCPPPASQQSVS